jgi:Uncharacterised nucleotidyltransferase
MTDYTFETLKLPNHFPREVTALLAALHLQRPDMAPLRALGDHEWRSLLSFCEVSHMTLLLALLPNEGLPEWVVDRLKRNLADNTLRFKRVKALYREAAEALAKAGVEHIVIKGFTQAPEYVAKPDFRRQSDLDLFCPRRDIGTAYAALQAIGYEPDDKSNISCADHVPALVRLGNWQGSSNPFDPEMPYGVELHFCLWNDDISFTPIPDVNLFWERRTTRQIGDLSFPCLNDVDQLGYLALHILRNIFLRDWVIRLVCELATFLHSHAHDDAFWQSWGETHSPSMRALQAIAFYHAHIWFCCRLHPQVVQTIAGLPPAQRSWLRRFSSSGLEIMFRENKDSLWLQLSFLSSRAKKWKAVRRTLIPTRVGSVNSLVVRMRNKRLIRFDADHPWQQYVSYLLSRSISHSRADLTALARGFRWYVSRLTSSRSQGKSHMQQPT